MAEGRRLRELLFDDETILRAAPIFISEGVSTRECGVEGRTHPDSKSINDS